MGTTITTKDSRLFVRCKTRDKALIEQAAATLGMSVSDYILSTAIERAKEEVQRSNRVLVTQAAFAQLQEFLETDPEPSPALLENVARYRQMVESGKLTVED